jgi:hypothetical protein
MTERDFGFSTYSMYHCFMSNSKRLRAKFYVSGVTDFGHGRFEVKLSAVYDSANNAENNQFASATPQGQLSMTVDNPNAFGFFKPGGEYYLDFQEAPKES